MLKLAKDAGPRSDIVHKVIEEEMLKILVDEDDYEELKKLVDVSVPQETAAATAPTTSATPQEDSQEEHPSLASLSQAERFKHLQTMLMEGYTNAEILALHPEIKLVDIIAAGADAARTN